VARKCEVCGKGMVTGFQVSHSHIRTKRVWKPNLQRVRAVINGTPKRILVCTRCLRSGKVQRAM
jgi:large subunit ribosomal protein L28